MRTIKFRGWDSERDTMYFSDQECDDFYFAFMGGTLKAYRIEEKFNGDEPPFPESEEIDSPVMQFTGLKDKNGKEIYEGDLLRFKNAKGYEEVFYKDGSFQIKTIGKPKLIGFMTQALMNDDFQIIGNICENPELL